MSMLCRKSFGGFWWSIVSYMFIISQLNNIMKENTTKVNFLSRKGFDKKTLDPSSYAVVKRLIWYIYLSNDIIAELYKDTVT